MKTLVLTPQAKEVVAKLTSEKDMENVGHIAAVDPQTGEIFYGNNVADAARKGRRAKNSPNATFFFVRVGYPSVHVLKWLSLQGEIQQDYFPKVKGFVQDAELSFVSSPPAHEIPLEFVADTGFSGALVVDLSLLERVKKDFVGVDTVTLAGGIIQQVNMYLISVLIDHEKFSDIETLEMPGEYLLGMSLMKTICKRAVFSFEENKILFET